jgi:hypothetical protein
LASEADAHRREAWTGEEVDTLLVARTRTVSQMRCTQLIPVPPSASIIERVGEQTFEIAVRRASLARVYVRSDFCEAYS